MFSKSISSDHNNLVEKLFIYFK